MAINYDDLLGQAQGMYSTIMGGYNNALSAQQQNQSRIMSGYNQLQDTVLGGLAGQGRARSQEIADQYTQQGGRAMQGLINSGLGNSTIQSAVGRGLTLDQAKAQNQLSEQVAAQTAQYQSQLGLAGLGYQNTANMQNTALLGQQLGYSSGWQSDLLGAAMSGLNMQEQARLQRQNQMFGALGGGGIVRGGGGGGGEYLRQPNPSGGQSMQGLIAARDMAYQADPWVDMGGGYGTGGYGGGGPYVHPGVTSATAASLQGLGGASALGGDPWGDIAYAGLIQGTPTQWGGGQAWDMGGGDAQWSDSYAGEDW